MLFPVMKELEKISQKTPGEVMLSIQGQVIKPEALLAHVNLAAYNLILEREREERNTDIIKGLNVWPMYMNSKYDSLVRHQCGWAENKEGIIPQEECR